MSVFHETMREILEDVQKFLNITLQPEHLSAASISHKETLLIKIHHLRSEYPQLHLQLIPETGSRSLASPPPYADMQGNPNLPPTDSLDEEYEVCDVQENSNQRQSKMLELESNVDAKGQYDSMGTSESGNFLKCGYLEKKGKDRLGGLINIFQRRWVGVKEGNLWLYTKSTDKKPCSQLSLGGYEARTVAMPNSKEGNKKDACFELVGPGRKTYQFVTSSRNEANEWVDVIQNVASGLPYEKATQSAPSTQSATTARYDASQGNSSDGQARVRSSALLNTSYESQNGGEDVYEMLDDAGNEVAIEEELYQDTDAISEAVTTTTTTTVRRVPSFVDSRSSPYSLDLYVGLWDWQGAEPDELEFRRGDVIKVVSKEFDELQWWVGELNGTVGLVPKRYLMEAYEIDTAAA